MCEEAMIFRYRGDSMKTTASSAPPASAYLPPHEFPISDLSPPIFPVTSLPALNLCASTKLSIASPSSASKAAFARCASRLYLEACWEQIDAKEVEDDGSPTDSWAEVALVEASLDDDTTACTSSQAATKEVRAGRLWR